MSKKLIKWKAHLNASRCDIPGHVIKVDDDAKFPIAVIWEGGGTHGKPFQLANAHLIAAAPELLAALITALPVLDDGEQDAREKARTARNVRQANQWLNVAEAFKADADAARAAIAKAGGGQYCHAKKAKKKGAA